eukprot:gene393-1027_t
MASAMNYKQKVDVQVLTKEIVDFCKSLEETELEAAEKEAALSDIKSIIKEVASNVTDVIAIGSIANGFRSKESDMDVTAFFSDWSFSTVAFLRGIERVVRARSIANGIEVVANATVPIITFTHKRYHIPFDISVENNNGVFHAVLLRAYTEQDNRLKPLFMALKNWAKESAVLDPRNNKLSSFQLKLMVIQYLQCGCQPRVLPSLQKDHPQFFSQPNAHFRPYLQGKALPDHIVTSFRSTNTQTLGELILGFFEYYSTFDWLRKGISIREGRIIQRPPRVRSNDTCIYVEDPYEERRNAARGVYKEYTWNNILAKFQRANRFLRDGKSYRNLIEERLG